VYNAVSYFLLKIVRALYSPSEATLSDTFFTCGKKCVPLYLINIHHNNRRSTSQSSADRAGVGSENTDLFVRAFVLYYPEYRKQAGGLYMQSAAYGTFRRGQVVFNEPVSAPDESSVIVVFLKDQKNEPKQGKNTLSEIFDTLGAWEDSRDTETIISEIEKSRVSRTADVVL